MKFYIAASWTARDVAIARAEALRTLGHEVISTWLNQDTVPYGDKVNAMIDTMEVMAADEVILLLDVGTASPGKHVELGVAIACRKKIRVIGDGGTGCVFYSHPICIRYETWSDFIWEKENTL